MFVLLQTPLSYMKPDSPLNGADLLCVAHDFAKVDVKHVAAVLQHNVVIVSVADS